MYNYIKGTVTGVMPGQIIIENNGIGYEIGVSGNTVSHAAAGKELKIYTYLYVREDAFALYGFSTSEEKSLFMRLIGISGVGPKAAMQILSGYDLGTLTAAIATGDVKTLTKIKGLGKKTAELIILNLKEQLTSSMTDLNTYIGGGLTADENDAVFALVSLGISNTDALFAVREAAKAVSGVENIVAAALKNFA
jgi:Holliday junction DNA helicase RuvA